MRRCITLAVLLCLLSLAAAHDSQTAFASFLMDQRLPTATLPPKGTPPPPARSSPTDTPEAEDDTPEAADTPTPVATLKPPELQPTSTATPLTELTKPTEIPGAAAYAVNLLGAWVTAGAPATQTFPYTGYDGATYAAVFAKDIQPLFTVENLWFAGAPACTSCHHENLENARHEMDLSSYAGILAGADRLSAPPGTPILGQSQSGAMDFNWETSVLQGRLRNNRMPPGMPFDISEANRDGPVIEVDGTAVLAVELVGAWVAAGAPETAPFGDYKATFAANILPLFTEPGKWYADAPACSSCHHGNLENAYHEMDLSSYAGILAGADRLSAPPGVPILAHSQSDATGFDWEVSTLRNRLRNNRMPPGMPFDISEANRDGPLVLHGEVVGDVSKTAVKGAQLETGDCQIAAVDLLAAWVDAGAPETIFPFTSRENEPCVGEFAIDIQPLFTEANLWYAGAPACTSCHHGNLENAYHEMDLNSYAGILAGADRLSAPPGAPILGQSQSGATDFNWATSVLQGRLRNNRMPPGMPFDVSEANRDGPLIEVAGTPVLAVELIGDWVAAGAPERAPFGDYKATFAANLLPLFTEPGMWYADAPACSSCHHANLENAYHEMDLSSYAGILAGADRLSTPLLGQPTHGSTAFDWEVSTLRNRLRNNRMPPGMPFDISEANRNGPLVQVGYVEGQERGASIAGITIDLTTPPDKAAVDRLVNRGGCKACHTIAGLDDAVGTLGPPWCKLTQEISAGENDLAFAYRSIVSPNAVVTEGYPANLMPGNFGELFSKEELQTLVAFIATLDCD